MTSYLLAGPAAEPVTLAEAKAWVKVDDAAEDGLIATLVAAARIHIEGTTGRALVAETWRLVLDCWPADGAIGLPVTPLMSLEAVTAYDADGDPTELDLDQFETDAGRVLLPPTIADAPALRTRLGIEIDYVAGYGDGAADVPADLRQAVLALVAYWYENRDAVIVASSGGVVPSGFDRLVAPYRERTAMTERLPALGTLTDRVGLKRRATTGEDEGGQITLYVPIATVWARVRTLSARSGTGADGRAVTISQVVVLRFRSDLGPGDRITYRGGALDIVSTADLNGRRAYLSCLCSETAVTG